ncbi:aminotransferase class I/II-fold pyridoxal phosphate-dependent enzyme [Saxibacter everestensis]|uniref:cysteine-S-conjugate beta-lyase n=1 Tax=Saxibacter everestensis TaxID=2909229 RepID=A0ABY8QS99_9MICO|nr:aminotransferase class I/II-fold pyridoxal phosphate-dependent enzyme [Brevibacteriaceae bacterium ZFBP1038]
MDMAAFHREIDARSIDALRQQGGFKWAAHPQAIGAFIAEMDFGLAAPIREAVASSLDTESTGYLSPRLADELGRATARWQLDHHGRDVPAAWIRPAADVLVALEQTIEYFTSPDDPIVLLTPAYMPFVSLPRRHGRRLVQVPMVEPGDEHGHWQLDLPALDRALGDGGLLVLVNPHNPIGKVYSKDELKQIAEIVERNGARVFADEIHAPMIYPGQGHIAYATINETTARHTVTAASASKSWNIPGLKCAQLIFSNSDDVDRWDATRLIVGDGAATPGVVANIAAYQHGETWLRNVMGYLDGNRSLLAELLAELLPEVNFTVPDATYLAWLDCRPLKLGTSPVEFFLDNANVALTDGALCGTVGQGHVRLNFATPRPILVQMVRQLAAAVDRAI